MFHRLERYRFRYLLVINFYIPVPFFPFKILYVNFFFLISQNLVLNSTYLWPKINFFHVALFMCNWVMLVCLVSVALILFMQLMLCF